MTLTFWDVLDQLGRGLALSQRGASRGPAERWGSLKYCQALSAYTETQLGLSHEGNLLGLSDEGKRIAMYDKALQSEERGHAFALAVSEQILSRRCPNHSISIVRADAALSYSPKKLGFF
ncbi:hypothetical protein [Streptomyces luteocolor]|uniref:hypothetical protein n=1 Tax=Streptomyces luteocolor TaxID=285500 RepID=UPI000852FB06|nr:hypothetical protein [Streptomyces luteocolor]